MRTKKTPLLRDGNLIVSYLTRVEHAVGQDLRAVLVGFRACIAADRLRSQCQQGFIDISPFPFGMIRWFLPVNTDLATNVLKGSAATTNKGNDGQRDDDLTSMEPEVEHEWTPNDCDSARRGRPAGQGVVITDCAGFCSFFY